MTTNKEVLTQVQPLQEVAQERTSLAKIGLSQAKVEVDLLFYKFMGAFGVQFTRNYPVGDILDSARAIWASELQKLTIHQIEIAWEEFLNQGFSKPPTLSEFIKMAKWLDKSSSGRKVI